MKKKNGMKRKVVSHLKQDIKMFKHEAKEDKKLIKSLRGKANGNQKKRSPSRKRG